MNHFDEYGTVYWYKFSDILAVQFNKIPYMSPNIITTLRNIALIHLCYKVFYKKSFDNLGINVLIIGIFDCLDGEYARKYNQITEFGDKYDHVSDLITNLVFFIIIFKYSKSKFNFIIGLIFLFTALQHMMCHERYRKHYLNIDTNRASLGIIQNVCPVRTKKGLELFLDKYRFLGYTTYYMVIVILMSKLKNNKI